MTISGNTGQQSPGAPPIPQGEQRTSGGGAHGGRLPSTSRERKPALAALGVLLILGGALASALLVIRSGDRISVIQIDEPVAAGQRIPLSAMTEVQVADTEVDTVPWSQRRSVAQYYAKVQLVPGTVLIDRMVTESSVLAGNRVLVGVALKPGQAPSRHVSKGDHVRVYAVGSGDSGVPAGTVLASDAIVYSTASKDKDISGRTMRVSLAVLPSAAPEVATAASQHAVAIALLPLGAGSGGSGGRQQNPKTGGNATGQSVADLGSSSPSSSAGIRDANERSAESDREVADGGGDSANGARSAETSNRDSARSDRDAGRVGRSRDSGRR